MQDDRALDRADQQRYIDNAITVYPLVEYSTPTKAMNAFLDAYFGDGAFEREYSAKLSGVHPELVEAWFLNPLFYSRIERRLQQGSKRRNSMQETMLEECQNIMSGNMLDVFDQAADGGLVLKNIKTLPRHIAAAVKQMDVVRTSMPGRPAVYTECLRIVMHDKAKVMNIIGDFTGVKKSLSKDVDSGAPKMVGLSLVTALPTPKVGQTDGQTSSERGEVSDDGAAEAGLD